MTVDSRSSNARPAADFDDPFIEDDLPPAPMLKPELGMDAESDRLRRAAKAGEPGAAEAFNRRHRPLFAALCDTFEFHRLCPRRGCRSARACRGDPSECYNRQQPALPAAVRGWGAGLLTAGRSGWTQVKLDGNYAEEKFAFQCWLAGLRAGHVRPSYERLLGRLRRGARDAEPPAS